MTRTIVQRGVTWAVDDLGGGREEWVRLRGSDHGEFRTGGPGSCQLLDAPSPARATRSTRPSARSTSTSRSRPLVVEIDRHALAMIDNVVRDGWEVGGPLIGLATSRGVEIVDATGPGTDADRGPHHVVIDVERARWFAEKCREAGFEGSLVGDWHSHGHRRGAVEPSRVDREAWAHRLEESGRDAWIGLIVADDPAGLGPPRWAAYATTRHGTERVALHLPKED